MSDACEKSFTGRRFIVYCLFCILGNTSMASNLNSPWDFGRFVRVIRIVIFKWLCRTAGVTFIAWCSYVFPMPQRIDCVSWFHNRIAIYLRSPFWHGSVWYFWYTTLRSSQDFIWVLLRNIDGFIWILFERLFCNTFYNDFSIWPWNRNTKLLNSRI